MPNVNIAMIAGHLGQDPELNYLNSGTPVLRMSVATSWGKQRSDGQWENFTDWHNVSAFGDLAKRIGETAKKGDPVFVQGSIRYESWTKDDGSKGYATKIVAFKINLLKAKPPTGEAEKTSYDIDIKDDDDAVPF